MIDEKIAGDNQHHVIPQSGSEVTAADLLQIPVVSWLKQKQVAGQPFALKCHQRCIESFRYDNTLNVT